MPQDATVIVLKCAILSISRMTFDWAGVPESDQQLLCTARDKLVARLTENLRYAERQ